MIYHSSKGENMDNKYLFKAKRKHSNQWVYGNLFHNFGEYYISKVIDDSFLPMLLAAFDRFADIIGFRALAYEIDPTTICRCTGIQDKNGNLIWENDIITYLPGVFIPVKFGEYEECLFPGTYLGFYLDCDGIIGNQSITVNLFKKSLDVEIMHNVEVIGNTFDNPGRESKKELKIDNRGSIEVTPSEFFILNKNSQSFSGVYILYNHTKEIYYIEQSESVYPVVNNHFIGCGDMDIYADYKYGDKFTIRLIPLKDSGFKTLNELEQNFILLYKRLNIGTQQELEIIKKWV